MKILWFSPPIWNLSGYGKQSFYWTKILQTLGHDVMVTPNCQLSGAPVVEWSGVKHLPFGWQRFGFDASLGAIEEWRPDLLISLFDLWAFPEDFGIQVRELGTKWLPIVPVDHEPIPKIVSDRISFAHTPIAMSPFGLRELRTMGGAPHSVYWPHGLDSRIFRYEEQEPISSVGTKEQFKVGMVAANLGQYDRKSFCETFEAFQIIKDKVPEAVFYVHTNPLEPESVDLIALAASLGINVKFPPTYRNLMGFADSQMAQIYRSLDVLISVGRGEGFGVPIIEAQACGTPVVTMNFTAPRDLNWFKQLQTEPLKRTWTTIRSWQGIPDPKKVAEAAIRARDLTEHEKINMASVIGAEYDFDTITRNYLIPFLRQMEILVLDREGPKVVE